MIKQTAEKVRAALDSAQERADQIVREAEGEARRIRSRAEAEARERLDQVREALGKLEAGLGAGSPPQEQSTEPKPQPPPEPQEPEADAREPEPPEPPQGKASTEELIERLKAGGPAANDAPESTRAAANEAPGDDVGAARLVAMKLALEGTARDEARKQLAADYKVDDLDSLLDEVYAKAGK